MGDLATLLSPDAARRVKPMRPNTPMVLTVRLCLAALGTAPGSTSADP